MKDTRQHTLTNAEEFEIVNSLLHMSHIYRDHADKALNECEKYDSTGFHRSGNFTTARNRQAQANLLLRIGLKLSPSKEWTQCLSGWIRENLEMPKMKGSSK